MLTRQTSHLRAIAIRLSEVRADADALGSARVPDVAIFYRRALDGRPVQHGHSRRLARAVVVDDVPDAAAVSRIQTRGREGIGDQVRHAILR